MGANYWGGREGDLGWDPRATGRIHLSTVFTEIGSDQHTSIMGEGTRNRHIQERGCLCVGRHQEHFPNAQGLSLAASVPVTDCDY